MPETLETTVPSHADFSMMAARIAQKASAWAADSLMLRESWNKPMRAKPLKRFTEEMRDLIEACNGR
jgi:hypothetical protein